MSRREHTIQELGFDTWLELYEFLVESNLQNEKTVALMWPDEEEVDVEVNDTPAPKLGRRTATVTISVEEIKGKAFDEIYGLLPLDKSVKVVADLVGCGPAIYSDATIKILTEFLNKLPTRKQ